MTNETSQSDFPAADDDVEGHFKAMAAPAEDDDVEGHRLASFNAGPAAGSDDDDVTGHVRTHPLAEDEQDGTTDGLFRA